MKGIFNTGGLGEMMRPPVWEVWVCVVSHPCALDDDIVCFTYNEVKDVFVPWGLNSVIRVVKLK